MAADSHLMRKGVFNKSKEAQSYIKATLTVWPAFETRRQEEE